VPTHQAFLAGRRWQAASAQASLFDEDEVAWGLYQWRGAGALGGHCP